MGLRRASSETGSGRALVPRWYAASEVADRLSRTAASALGAELARAGWVTCFRSPSATGCSVFDWGDNVPGPGTYGDDMTLHRLCALAAIGTWALFASAPGQASIVTFDDFVVVPTGNGSAKAVKTVSSAGFAFVAPQFHIIVNPALCGLGGCAGNGTHYAVSDIPDRGIDPTSGGPVTMSRIGGGAFTLLAFDGSTLLLDDVAASLAGLPNANSVEVVGHQSGGGIVSASFALDNIKDGDGGLPDFQTFSFGNEWTDLISVDWSGAAGPRAGLVAFDNIVAVVEVAEPAPVGLLGLALLVMCSARTIRRGAPHAARSCS